MTKQRGEFIESDWAPKCLATYHPSAIINARTEQDRERQHWELIEDLRRVANAL